MNAIDTAKLDEYAGLDGTEIGEYVNTLLQLRTYNDCHGMTERFSSELDGELSHWLARFKDETVIEKTTWQPPEVKGKELVWL